MATKTTAPKTETPAAATPKSFTVGKFTFAVRTGGTIPADIPKAPNPNALPFKDHFADMGHHDELFIPTSFWTGPKADGGREVEAAKATMQYQKDKFRDQFKKFKEAADPKGSRDNHSLVFVPRLGTEEGYEEAGLSIFMVYPEALRPKAPADKK